MSVDGALTDVSPLSWDRPAAGATTRTAAGGQYPIVTRIFADKERAKPEQRMHALLGGDLYFVPYSATARSAPASLVDFRGVREHVGLKRLPPGSSIDDVCATVARCMPATYGDRALVISGRVRERNTGWGGKADPADVIVVLESAELAEEWVEALRMRVMPWDLIRKRVKAAFTESTAENEAHNILHKMQEAVAKDREMVSADKEPPRVTVRCAQDLLRRLGRVAKFSSVANVIAPSTAACVKASEIGDTMTRFLGGVALAGPVLSVAALGLRCAELAAQARDGRVLLGRLLTEELPQVSRCLALSVYHILSCRVPMEEIVGNIFDAIEECWKLLLQMERHLLEKRRNQIRHTDRLDEVLQSMRSLKQQLQFAQQGKALAESRLAITALEGRMKEWEMGICSRRDKLVQSVYVGPQTPMLVSRSALPPQYDKLLAAVLAGGTVFLSDGSDPFGNDFLPFGNIENVTTLSAPILAVEGQGGVGKTTTLLLLAADERVREQFEYAFFLELGQHATEGTLVAALADLVQAINRDLAQEIREIPRGENRLQLAVNLIRTRLQSKRILLILDNVWVRVPETSVSKQTWVDELAPIVSKAGSAVLVSTRHKELARCAQRDKRFAIGLLKSKAAEMSIFELHADLEPGAALPRSPPDIPVLEEELQQYEGAVDYVLEICSGWPLALAMCGALVRSSGYQWGKMRSRIRASVVEVHSAWQYVKHPGLQAVLHSSLSLASDLGNDNALFLVLGPESARRNFLERVNFAEKFQVLATLDGTRSIPVYALGALFSVSDEEAEVIARVFAWTGLATLRLESRSSDGGKAGREYLVLVLHDLQHAFAETLGIKNGVPVSKHHWNILSECGKRFCDAGVPSELEYDWSLLCERHESGSGNDNLATYMCNNLVRHLIDASCDAVHAKVGLSRVVALLCSYGWIRARGAAFGRQGVLKDFSLAVALFREKEGTNGEHSSDALLRHGELGALEIIAEVLQRIPYHRYDPIAPCQTHGERDSGLAGALYGRLAVLKCEGLEDDARHEAMQIVLKLRESIFKKARPPWLLPRNECYGSVECKDARCKFGFPAGNGTTYALAFVRSGSEELLLSGGSYDGVRLRDVRAGGGELDVWSDHKGVASSVAVADEGYAEFSGAAVVAVSSDDGSVRLWNLFSGGHDCKMYLGELHSCEGEKLRGLAITRDAHRVAGGMFFDGNSSVVADELVGFGGEFCVYVWTLRNLAPEGSLSLGEVDYATLALTAGGHTGPVTAVQMYQNGERIVSGSHDGTVRMWRVPMNALLTAVDVDRPDVVDLRTASPSFANDRVRCLAMDGNSTSVFAGMDCGSIHVIDCESRQIRASLRTSETCGASVYCMTMITACGSSADVARERLFAGHANGVISEWDVGFLSCLTVYGDVRSGAARIFSIAARLVQAGDHGNGGGPKSTRDVARCGDVSRVKNGEMGCSKSAVELVTGCSDGIVRMWHAGPPFNSSSKSTPEVECESTNAAGKRANFSDVIECISASANGQYLVSGSREGLVCVWNVESGDVMVPLPGHSERINGVDMSGDGHVVASCSSDNTARVWKSNNGHWSLLTVLRHDAMVSCIVLTENASVVITGDSQGHVRLWVAASGLVLSQKLKQRSAIITSLAVVLENEEVMEYDPGWSSSPSKSRRMSTGFKVKLAQCRDRFLSKNSCSESSPRDCYFASRDATGSCALWRLESDEAITSIDGVPFERSLKSLFLDEVKAVNGSIWNEKKYWFIDKPRTFTLNARDDEQTDGCVVSIDRSRALEVLPSTSAPPAQCSCVARICLGTSVIQGSSLHAFSRHNGEAWQTFLCCGLSDGKVAILQLVRTLL